MKKKTVLRVQPIYTILIWGISFCCFVLFLFLPYILQWQSTDGLDILYYCLMGLCALISAGLFIYYIQFAYVDSECIIIRGLFYNIVKLRWADIKCITCENILTYDNRSDVSLKWIVISTNETDIVKGRAGRNRRNKSPWCIIATKYNLETLGKYYKINVK